MKIYILTSVALFAEYGDLSSLDTPAIHSVTFRTIVEARSQMERELETEKQEAKQNGYENVVTELSEKTAFYTQGEPGSGSSWNSVTWEITEHEIPDKSSAKKTDEDQQSDALLHFAVLGGAVSRLKHDLVRFINDPSGKKTVILSTGETAIDMDDAWLIIGKNDNIHNDIGSPFLRDKRTQRFFNEHPENAYNELVSSSDKICNWDTDRLYELAETIMKQV